MSYLCNHPLSFLGLTVNLSVYSHFTLLIRLLLYLPAYYSNPIYLQAPLLLFLS
jgi:hypothetical protein